MTWQRTILWFSAAWLMCGGIGACAGSHPGAQPKPSMQAQPNPPITDRSGMIGQVIAAPERFESRNITVTGSFQGWRGPCRNAPPVSRSDWMITDGSNCIYVHGPLPPGLDPAAPGDEKITITGVVRIKRDHPYLDATR